MPQRMQKEQAISARLQVLCPAPLVISWHENRRSFLSYLKKGGSIVYATCSLLQEENENQLQYFLKRYPLTLGKELKLLPTLNGNDGFYGVVLDLLRN